MKTSWNDIALIERYLDHELSESESEVVSNRLVSDSAFRQNVIAQTQVRQLVRRHHLLLQRERVRNWHQRLYNDPARRTMRRAIEAIFKL